MKRPTNPQTLFRFSLRDMQANHTRVLATKEKLEEVYNTLGIERPKDRRLGLIHDRLAHCLTIINNDVIRQTEDLIIQLEHLKRES